MSVWPYYVTLSYLRIGRARDHRPSTLPPVGCIPDGKPQGRFLPGGLCAGSCGSSTGSAKSLMENPQMR